MAEWSFASSAAPLAPNQQSNIATINSIATDRVFVIVFSLLGNRAATVRERPWKLADRRATGAPPNRAATVRERLWRLRNLGAHTAPSRSRLGTVAARFCHAANIPPRRAGRKSGPRKRQGPGKSIVRRRLALPGPLYGSKSLRLPKPGKGGESNGSTYGADSRPGTGRPGSASQWCSVREPRAAAFGGLVDSHARPYQRPVRETTLRSLRSTSPSAVKSPWAQTAVVEPQFVPRTLKSLRSTLLSRWRHQDETRGRER